MTDKPVFTMQLRMSDAQYVVKAVNQGIDSRLEGFTQSTFQWDNFGALNCNIENYNELQTLIRRLLESENRYAEQLADDIVYVKFGYETI